MISSREKEREKDFTLFLSNVLKMYKKFGIKFELTQIEPGSGISKSSVDNVLWKFKSTYAFIRFTKENSKIYNCPRTRARLPVCRFKVHAFIVFLR